jgi:hypothetical protein
MQERKTNVELEGNTGLQKGFFFLFLVPGLEIWAFTLSHSTSPIFCDGCF